VKFKQSVSGLLNQKKILFTSPIKLGTDRPFWEASFNGAEATFNIIMAKREGLKIDFIKERVLTLLTEDLAYLFPEDHFDIESAQMCFTLDVFIEDKNYGAFKKQEGGLAAKLVHVIEDSAPLLISRLKNVLYFGPYNEDALGTFSSLIEIKKWRESL
jgi:hypothetical protein